MANRTAWTPGNGAGITWTPLFGSEIVGLTGGATGGTVLSSVSVANGSALDQFMDVSIEAKIAANTIAAGANFALWIMPLMEDGVTYGDNTVTTTPGTLVPGLFPAATLPLHPGGATGLYGYAQGIVLPPGTFSCALQNNSGFGFTGATGTYRTYNQNLNN